MHLKKINKTASKYLSMLLSCILIFYIVFYLSVDKVKAEDNSSNIDVVFAIDASQSMIKSDPNNIRYQAIKMFLDMCHTQGDRAGLAAYSDKIVKESKLVPLNSEQDKQNFYASLGSITLGQWTDIGLGLKEAVNILKTGQDKSKKPLIVLLSDGKNDPSRDKSLSEQDLNSALSTAKAQNYPVYTIALNADGTVDKNQLGRISTETSGKAFTANSAGELTEILKDIFVDVNKVGVLSDNSITGTGDFQNVSINIPDSGIVEANISILSSSTVELKVIDPSGKEQQVPSKNIIVTKTDTYSVVKLLNPMKGSWILKIKGNKGEKIDTSLVSNTNLKAAMNIDSSTKIHKGDKLKISAYAVNSAGKLTDEELYRTLKGKLIVKKLSDNSVEQINLSYSNNSFNGEYIVKDTGKYQFSSVLEGSAVSLNTGTITLTTENNVPEAFKKLGTIVLSPGGKTANIDLYSYFKDMDNDELTYSIGNNNADFVRVSINGGSLNISPLKKGNSSIVITAKDGKGGIVSQTLNIKVNSKLVQFLSRAYVIIILVLVIIISAVMIIRIQLRLRSLK